MYSFYIFFIPFLEKDLCIYIRKAQPHQTHAVKITQRALSKHVGRKQPRYICDAVVQKAALYSNISNCYFLVERGVGGLLLKVVNGTGMWLRGQNYNARSFSRVSSAMVAWCTVRKAVHLKNINILWWSLGFSSNLERRLTKKII